MSDDPSMHRDDHPTMESVVCEGLEPVGNSTPVRPLGLLVGKINIPDDFDDPLPGDILAVRRRCQAVPRQVCRRFG